MALLKIKVPKALRSNHYLEQFFYQYFPKLPRVKLNKFIYAPALAVAFNLDITEVRDFVVQSRTVHGLEHNKVLYVHPTVPMQRLALRMKRLLSKQFIKESPKV